MTIKKVVSLSFLLLANTAIVAHSVVCHHHDNPMSVAMCAANQQHRCDENAEHQHRHDSGNTNQCCVFDNCLLNIPFTKAAGYKQIKPTFNNVVSIISNFPVYRITQITDLAGLPFRQKPYLQLFYPEFISQSMGLRAPPGC